jgi:restriction system protein
MARKSNFEVLVEAASLLPWWANALLAVAAYFGFHMLAQMPIEPSKPGAMNIGPMMIRSFATAFQYLAPLAFGVAAIVSAFKRNKRRNLLETQTGLQSVKELSWQEFELLVGELFRKKGYSIHESGGSRPDGGVDLVAQKDGEKYLIQCKHWQRHKIDVRVVREFLGVLYRAGAAGGMIVTTGEFTQSARNEGAGQSLELIDGSELVRLIKAIDVDIPTSAETSSARIDVPACPECGAEMTRRHNKKTGQPFWGCPKFPACRGTRPT